MRFSGRQRSTVHPATALNRLTRLIESRNMGALALALLCIASAEVHSNRFRCEMILR